MKPALATTFLALLLAANPLHGADIAQPSAFHDEFAALEQEEAELGERYANATDEQWRDALRNWHEQTALRRDALMQLALTLYPPVPVSDEPISIDIPKSASTKEREFTAAQVALDNEVGEIASQHVDPEKWRDAVHEWHERNAKRLAAQETLGKELQVLQRVLPLPAKVQTIPADTTPSFRAFLQEEASLAQEEYAVQEKFSTASPEARRDAIHSLHLRTALRRSAHLQEAQTLSAE